VAAERPDLVNALVLLSPATPPNLPDPRIHWPTAGRLLLQAIPILGPVITRRALSGMTPEEIVNLSLELITHKRGRVPLHMVESFVDLARARMELPWASESVPKTGNSIARHFVRKSDFVAMIREIKAPTLVIHGLEDHIVSPTSVEWLCSLRPDWTLVQMEDTGHTPQIDAPVRLLSIATPWLAEHLKRQHTA
jgi:pimeloyl-ACP methyl ester carboxylesterase